MPGGYGLRIAGLEHTGLLGEADVGWPTLSVTQGSAAEVTPGLREVFDLGPASVTVGQDDVGYTVNFALDHVVPDDHLVHPYLALPAALVSRWEGRECFHAGGVVLDDRVWAVCGRPGMGKTSTMAWLLLQGLVVFTDDVLVVDGTDAFSGPRCLDLREGSAAHLGLGTPLGIVGSRERWRVALGPAPGPLPLGGWIFLEWGDDLQMTPVPLAERIELVFEQEALGRGPARPERYLDLAALPAWRLTRPEGLEHLEPAGVLLTDTLTRAAGRY